MSVVDGPSTENDTPFEFVEDDDGDEFSRFRALTAALVSVPKVDTKRRES